MAITTAIPRAALEWLTGTDRTSILLVGSATSYAMVLSRMGHTVTVVDPDVATLSAMGARRAWIRVVAGRAEALPFDPSCFAVVLFVQNFHTMAPGLALSEAARILTPDGRLGLAYVTRDDTVPWVKRMRRIVQTYLPEAMTSDYGVQSATQLGTVPYFPAIETVTYRLWVPCTRAQMQDSASHSAGTELLDPVQLEKMLDQVGQLYDAYARSPDPLMLPYKIQCWRAKVDKTRLPTSVAPIDQAVSIRL
jgi:SAM-dependent methyltransferase